MPLSLMTKASLPESASLGVRYAYLSLPSPKKKISLLSEAESQVIRTIRDDEVKSVKIIKSASEQIDIIEEIRTGRVEKEARIMDLILSHGYQTIEIKTQNGSIVHCENKIKKRIDKVSGTV